MARWYVDISEYSSASNSTSTMITSLPLEMLEEIFQYLKLRDLISLSQAAPRFQEVTRNVRFWSKAKYSHIQHRELVMGKGENLTMGLDKVKNKRIINKNPTV